MKQSAGASESMGSTIQLDGQHLSVPDVVRKHYSSFEFKSFIATFAGSHFVTSCLTDQ